MLELKFKRLNVITNFETKVYDAFQNEDYEIRINGYKKNPMGVFGSQQNIVCIAVKKPDDLNVLEMDYICKHMNKRKSFLTAFVMVSDLKSDKNVGKLTSFAKAVKETILTLPDINDEDFYFIAMKSIF